MNKKNIMLTFWLALPITIVSLLMVWIFYSMDKERLMADAVPIGAGAGDTGNANALGQWLAGRDANAVSRALDARREGRTIDPRDWPGGVTIKIPLRAFGVNPESTMLVFVDDQSLEVLTQDMTDDGNGYRVFNLSQEEAQGFFFYATALEPTLLGSKVVDSAGRILKPIIFDLQIPDPNLQVADPIKVEVEMDSVFENSP
ncbi:MAG: hypothetical protein P1U42_07555 [Phycisphaerales bacterium]|nr:hypothetical protein [Phycisphaerales bacterium]